MSILFCSQYVVAKNSNQVLHVSGLEVLSKQIKNVTQEKYLEIFPKPPEDEGGFINPTGAHWNNPTNKCSKDMIKQIIKNFRGTNEDLNKTVESWVYRCRKEHNKYSKYGAILRFQMLEYDLNKNPEVFEVRFTLKNGIKLRGILGIKDFKTPRPLVISKCGLYCNAGEGATSKDSFMHLFDEGPFNLLLLSSNTGSHYSKDNHELAFGGFNEGEQIMEIADLLTNKESSVRHLIKGVHIHGLSLGGNAALMAGVYAIHNPQIPIESVVATCPVINLKDTMKSIFENDLRGGFYRLMTMNQIKNVYSDLSGISNLLPSNRKYQWSQDELFNAFSKSTYLYHKKLTQKTPWETAPFEGVVVNDQEHFWSLNNFINFTDEVSVPTTVLYSSDDAFVSSKYNVRPLKEKLSRMPNSHIGTLNLRRGNHCGFSLGVGWDIYSSILNNLYIKNTQDTELPVNQQILQFADRTTRWKKAFSFSKTKKLSSHQVIVKSEWTLKEKSDSVLLKLTVFDSKISRRHIKGGRDLFCKNKSPYVAHASCYRSYSTEIQLRSLGNLNLKTPQNEFEANRMARWLNTNTQLTNEYLVPAVGSNLFPQHVHYKNEYLFH